MDSHLGDNKDVFDFIQQDALDGFWMMNIDNQKDTWVSGKFWELLGYDAHWKGDDCEKINSVIYSDDKKEVIEALASCKEIGDKRDLTARFYHKNSKIKWLKLKAKCVSFKENGGRRLLIAFIDITEEKENETYLVSCNAAANIGYWEVNFETMRVLWSPIIKQIHGVSQDYEPELDTAIKFFKEGEHRDKIVKVVGDATDKGIDYNVEVILVTANGEECWIKSIGFSEINNGKCVRLYGTFQDINERKQSELEMISLLNKTREQNLRLQNFKNIVSHNLRSHSGNIELMTEMLEEDKPEIIEVEPYQMLKSATNNLSETIHHLSEVSKVNDFNRGEMKCISIKNYVVKALENVAASAVKSEVTIINEVTTSENILGFPAYIDSVLLNFLTNSIKYRSLERESVIRLSTEISSEWHSLLIEDNGVGIDLKRHRDKLFGMYKTFHENQDARGIGLFITRNHIEAMGGNIEVESEIDKGTVFKINFKYEKS